MIFFVFNKISGTYTEEREILIRTRSLKLFENNFKITYTLPKGDLFVPDIDPDNIVHGDIIVAVGGDGTINLCLQFIHDNLLSEKVSLGSIPAGTGNNMVKISGLSKDVVKSIDIIKNNLTRELRYGTINDKKVFFNFSLGFTSFVLNNRRTNSLIGYAFDGIRSYFSYNGVYVKILSDISIIEKKVFIALFINTSHYLSFIRLIKENDTSGYLNLFYLTGSSKFVNIIKLLPLLFGINFLKKQRLNDLTIELQDDQQIEVDGDIYETNEKILRIKNSNIINFISG
ncbi:MAG: hypothetical protein JXR69_03400 [Candidatus Delongbacteria bacterium]|nr:hypothetical protein [Candidatus Delongbacteria bacterium]